MPDFRLDQMLNNDDHGTILTALYERRNRLTQLAESGAVFPHAEPNLRSRIADCNRVIRRIKNAKVVTL